MVFIVSPVRDAIIAERHVADSGVEESVGGIGFLKAYHLDVGLLVELFGDPSGDGVQLHAVELGVVHTFGQHSEKVTHAAGRFQQVVLFIWAWNRARPGEGVTIL